MTTDLPAGYDPSRYEHPSVTVDVVIFSLIEERLRVLLIQRRKAPYAGSEDGRHPANRVEEIRATPRAQKGVPALSTSK